MLNIGIFFNCDVGTVSLFLMQWALLTAVHNCVNIHVCQCSLIIISLFSPNGSHHFL
jgi:hypothetical protein